MIQHPDEFDLVMSLRFAVAAIAHPLLLVSVLG